MIQFSLRFCSEYFHQLQKYYTIPLLAQTEPKRDMVLGTVDLCRHYDQGMFCIADLIFKSRYLHLCSLQVYIQGSEMWQYHSLYWWIGRRQRDGKAVINTHSLVWVVLGFQHFSVISRLGSRGCQITSIVVARHGLDPWSLETFLSQAKTLTTTQSLLLTSCSWKEMTFFKISLI